ncbi:hypothetical protein GYMLUDRAFT_64947 [Collybiopsis luxurians FD-317 M1]|uniref:Unplaced genomic scaffold GYMLUscaffold_122, whole genome shotgun sequence n=1 Tax=Collybiopsis luxurians FD-317 M1 TaxID=944289 RepID=A0A0D0BA68_9AGAR|nr:hypothetical protein GYMLUDRAFT_64947 [Collybiopsis luxurians FD-317 M1]
MSAMPAQSDTQIHRPRLEREIAQLENQILVQTNKLATARPNNVKQIQRSIATRQNKVEILKNQLAPLLEPVAIHQHETETNPNFSVGLTEKRENPEATTPISELSDVDGSGEEIHSDFDITTLPKRKNKVESSQSMSNRSADSTEANGAHLVQSISDQAVERLRDSQLGAPILQPEGTTNNLGRQESSSSLKDIEERVGVILDNALGKRQMTFSPPAVASNSIYTGNGLSDGARDLMIGWRYHRIWQNYVSKNFHPGTHTSPETSTQEGPTCNKVSTESYISSSARAPNPSSVPPLTSSPGHMTTSEEAAASKTLAVALSSAHGVEETTASKDEHPRPGEENVPSQLLPFTGEPQDSSIQNTVPVSDAPSAAPFPSSSSYTQQLAIALSSVQGEVAATASKAEVSQPAEKERPPAQFPNPPATPEDNSILNPAPGTPVSTDPSWRVISSISAQNLSASLAQMPNSMVSDLTQEDDKYPPETTGPSGVLPPLPPSSVSVVLNAAPLPEKPLTVDLAVLTVPATSEGIQIDANSTISSAPPTSSSQSNSLGLLPLGAPESLSTMLSTNSMSSDKLRELITAAAQMGLTLIDFEGVKMESSLDARTDVEMSEAKADMAQAQTKPDHSNTPIGPTVPLATDTTLDVKRKRSK